MAMIPTIPMMNRMELFNLDVEASSSSSSKFHMVQHLQDSEEIEVTMELEFDPTHIVGVEKFNVWDEYTKVLRLGMVLETKKHVQ